MTPRSGILPLVLVACVCGACLSVASAQAPHCKPTYEPRPNPRFRAVSAPRSGAAALVTVRDYQFDADGNPATQFDTVRIAPGESVTWEWEPGSLNHTITSGTDSGDPNAGLLFDDVVGAGIPTYTVTFPDAGVFPYFCAYHELNNMFGVVKVASQATGVRPGGAAQGARFVLGPWPNPSTGRVEVRLALARDGTLELAVYDPRGRRVATLYEGERGAGEWAFSWDGRDARGRAVVSGLYYLRARAGEWSESRSVVIGR